MFYNKLVLDVMQKTKTKTNLVTYEEFVLNKEKTLSTICNFLNIEYDENCFNYQDT